MTLEPLTTLTMTMAKPLVLPQSPAGTRVVVEFTKIIAEGDKLRGASVGPAGDWLRIGPEGTACLDFRFSLLTHDGALIYVAGQGRTDAAGFATGAPVTFAPLFETGDARYAWLNKVVGLARGSAKGDAIVFDVRV